MEDVVTNLTTEFHNLQGLTVAEKKKNFCQRFLNNSQLRSNKSLLDYLTPRLAPQNHLERLLFVDFLIHFHRYEELHQEFLNGNDIVISKISKHNWFFERMFEQIGAEFVTQTLPNLSHNLRLKLLTKMVPILNPDQGDQIFDALLKVYGLFIATIVLTCCSVNKIQEIFKTRYVKLSICQLKQLYHKNADLIYLYLDEREKHEGNKRFMDSNPIFQYIAQNNVEMYCDLYLKYGFKVKLGKRTTKKLVISKRQEIIEAPDALVKTLHPGRLVRNLGPDFKTVYFKLFPRRVEDSPSAESSKLLNYYAKNGRYNLLKSTFNQVFHKKLHESPHLIDEYLLTMITDGKERESLAQLKIKNGADNEDIYLKYFEFENCFQAIKEKINFLREPYERDKWTSHLISSCLINDDYDALLEATRFAAQRFKNDTSDVRDRFLDQLVNKKCNFKKLTQQHWDEINMLARRQDVRSVTTKILFYRYIEFLCTANKSIADEILSFFDGKDFTPSDVQQISDALATKQFLCAFIEVAPRIQSPKTSVEDLDCQLLMACKNYNVKHPLDTIDVHRNPRLVQSVKTALLNGLVTQQNVLPVAVEVLICTQHENEQVEELRRIYWTKLEKAATPSGVRWFLKHRPDLIAQNLETFLTFVVSNKKLNEDFKVWNQIKCCSHLSIDQKTVDIALVNLADESSKNPQFWTRSLSRLMPPEEFFRLVQSYVPGSHKIDLQDNEMSRAFQIQKHLLKGLKLARRPLAALPLIWQFFRDDYVVCCLSPMYSAFYNIPSVQTKSYIDDLNRGGISVKKHFYYLICALFDEETIVNSLRQCNLNQSVAVTFKYFLKNPSQVTWELFQSKLTYFDNNDKHMCTLLVNGIVPTNFKGNHFITAWEAVSSDQYKKILLNNTQSGTLSQLNSEAFAKIIEGGFLQWKETNKIVSSCLIGCKNQEILDVIVNYLKNYKSSPQFSNKKICNFLFTFFTTYMAPEGENAHLVKTFSTRFQDIYPFVECFEGCVTLSVMTLKHQILADFSQSIIELHQTLVARFGETITNAFANCLKKLLPHFCKTTPEKYEFYYLLLNASRTNSDLLLVIQLLPTDSEPEDIASFTFYDRTLSQLQQSEALGVKLYLNMHFKLHKVCRNFEYYQPIRRWAISTSSWLCPGARRKVGYTYF